MDAEFHREVCALQASFEKRYQEVYDKVRGGEGGEGGRGGEGRERGKGEGREEEGERGGEERERGKRGGGEGKGGVKEKGRERMGGEMYMHTMSSIRLVGGDGRGVMKDLNETNRSEAQWAMEVMCWILQCDW